jgi:hypothetical protein
MKAMEFLLLAALVGLIPAVIAHNKGHSFLGWWIFGAALFIVALPMAIVLKPNEDRMEASGELRRCPHCAEMIRPQAVVCRYCGRDVSPVPVAAQSLRGRVLEWTFEHPNSTPEEIAGGLGADKYRVREELDRMRKEGLAIWGRGNRWILTPKGAGVVTVEDEEA